MEEVVLTPVMYDRCSKEGLVEVLGKRIEGAKIKVEPKEIKQELKREEQ